MLLSNYEESGRQIVCPGEQITFTCTGKDISVIKRTPVDGGEPGYFTRYTPLDSIDNRTLRELDGKLICTCTCTNGNSTNAGDITTTLTSLVVPWKNVTEVICSGQTAKGEISIAKEILFEGE